MENHNKRVSRAFHSGVILRSNANAGGLDLENHSSYQELVDNVSNYFCEYYTVNNETSTGGPIKPWNYQKNGADWGYEGKEQSPIHVNENDVSPSATEYLKMWWSSQDLKATVINNGHTFVVKGAVSRLVGTTHDGRRHNALYEAMQFHFHSPSEHKLTGKTYPLEIHFVHAITEDYYKADTPNRNVAVFGVFFEVDDSAGPNPFIQALQLDNIGSEITLNMYDMLGWVEQPEFYGYQGSLTTPPCSEVVNWFLMKTPLKITSKQLKYFDFGKNGNNRICQPLNSRKVYCGNCNPFDGVFAAAVPRVSITADHIAVAKAIHTPVDLLVLSFEDFKSGSSLPSYSDVLPLLRPLSQTSTAASLNIFISHNWIAASDGTESPDNSGNDKFRLCVTAIQRLLLLSGVDSCYIWMDCVCSDSSYDASVTHLWALMEFCDCMLTPVIGEQRSSLYGFTGPMSYYSDYNTSDWNEGDASYIHKSSKRLDMFFAAAVPLTDAQVGKKLGAGLGLALQENRRAHLLFGLSEERNLSNPLFLPPLQYSYLEALSPLTGTSKSEDKRIKVDAVMATMKPFVLTRRSKYKGALVESGFVTYGNGDLYEGAYSYGRRNGKGMYSYAKGETYDGEWVNGMTFGKGKVSFGDGAIFEGMIAFDLFDGRGRFDFANGDSYEGIFKSSMFHRHGKYRWANGASFVGGFCFHLWDGPGVFTAVDGKTHTGFWDKGKCVRLHTNAIDAASHASRLLFSEIRKLNETSQSKKRALNNARFRKEHCGLVQINPSKMPEM